MGKFLFEDNAEFGLGMHLGEIKLRRRVEEKLNEVLPSSDENTKTAIEEWLAGKDVGTALGAGRKNWKPR